MKKNLRIFERPYPRVAIHPDSIKHTQKGHPWIISDSFTKKFPKPNLFLIGVNPKTKDETLLFINDWRHPKIKGRVWSHQAPFVEKVKNFQQDFGKRLEEALEKRLNDKIHEERENFYWVFGEGDLIPGLFIQFLGPLVLIQSYATFWFPMEFLVVSHVERLLEKYFPERDFSIMIQERFPGARSDFKHVTKSNKIPSEFVLNEFGINYEIHPYEHHDPGIYTDASSIRKKLLPYYEESKNILNLYSYTGAFSLYGLSKGKDVVSVDLSQKYIDWLERNISLNEFSANHQSMAMNCEMALKKLAKEDKKFDFVICDPPSSSSDGKKTSQALKKYEELVPMILDLLESKGHAALFLNTHSVSKKKFQNKILELIKGKGKITNEFKLGEDCPTLRGFQEGNYLKVLIVKKN